MTGQSLHERTAALLREIEWNGIRQDGEYCCPCCWMDKHRHGHKCELAAILAEHEHAAAGDEARDAARYRWWRENFEVLIDEEAGIESCAFSCQIPLSVIDEGPPSKLFDMVADFEIGIEDQALADVAAIAKEKANG